MHKLTKFLCDESKDKIVSYVMLDKIITDYLNGRAEWLKEVHDRQCIGYKSFCLNIDQAFELEEKPKEEKCEHQYPKSSIADDGSCVFCGKFPIPSQPEKEVEYGGICYVCKGKNGKHETHCSRIFSQPEKELPRKLNYIDKYPHPNHISLDVVCSQKIDEIIDYLQSLRKEK